MQNPLFSTRCAHITNPRLAQWQPLPGLAIYIYTASSKHYSDLELCSSSFNIAKVPIQRYIHMMELWVMMSLWCHCHGDRFAWSFINIQLQLSTRNRITCSSLPHSYMLWPIELYTHFEDATGYGFDRYNASIRVTVSLAIISCCHPGELL